MDTAPSTTSAETLTQADSSEVIEIKSLGKAVVERRLKLRELVMGPDLEGHIWHKREKGFCTIPRWLPLITTLIRMLTRNVDASRVYNDLWSRQYEDGFIDVHDEQEFAASCGYANGSRGVRSWREGMMALEELGFIRAKPKGSRKFGYILLPHPQDIVADLIEKDGANIPDWWRGLFYRRLIEVGARTRGS
jgi:hypothetical protein